ncbi:MAG: hypothetical protein P9F19_17470 [Candidatus Contendobacter sp.]|nr:hypothetical protein [Candidatus Contendobacter sp.]MDG4559158.1 hypothetical protein [Candidatus Contendobacter sp.]
MECPIARLLLTGNSVSLFGLRRIGKSSLLVGIEELIRKGKAVPVTLELQGAHRIETLVGKLMQACEKEGQGTLVDGIRSLYAGASTRMPAAVRAVYRLVTGGAGEGQESQAGVKDVLDYLEVALGPLAEKLQKSDRKIVLILDELPFFCQDLHGQGGADKRHVAAFLSELRRWRRDGLTMLVGGSIGVHRLERDLGIDPNLFGDLNHEQLPPLENEDAAALVAALVRGCAFDFWTPEHAQGVIAAPPAAYPTFFQSIFLELQRAARGRALTAERTGEIAVETTEKLLQDNFFPQFNHRLTYYEAAEAEVAMKLFRVLAREPTPIAADVLGKEFPEDWPLARKTALLAALRQDDFLQKLPGNHFAFAMPLVAAWWKEQDALAG